MMCRRAGACASLGLTLWLVAGCSVGDDAAPALDASVSDAGRVLDAGLDAATDAALPPLDASEPHDAAHADAAPSDGAASDPDASDAAADAAGVLVPEPLNAPAVLAPTYLGILVGPGASQPAPNLQLYGTDLGITFEHDGKLQMLFGDTWFHDEQVCGDAPLNDDTLAVMPLALGSELPHPRFVTRTSVPELPAPLSVMRGGESLSMGFGQVPMAAFSDGAHAFAFFARLAPESCEGDVPHCGSEATLACSERIGECQPAYTTMTLSCDLATQAGCLPGQECVAGAPVCIDPYSAQNDGSIFGETSAVAQRIELAIQGATAADFHSVHTWPTSKFATLTARTIARFSGERAGSDYAPGHGELLVWGRPGFIGEHGREAQLYLMRHRLPFALDAGGAVDFRPLYFAGLDATTREPRWTKDQALAQPLALDGTEGGSAHEQLYFTGQPAVSWLGAPINKWVMLYGGDITDFLMVDAAASRTSRAPGAIAIRFADHPWGPWSPPAPHLSPGTPGDPRSLYAPGGLLYHPDCVDDDETRCARSDPWRPPDSATACLVSTQALDPGRLYGANIIDRYTAPNEEGGLDFVWNVSLWNPYSVALMRTRVLPPPEPVAPDELADARGLQRLSDFGALPTLDPGRRYRQQTSRDRGTGDTSFPLSGFGNRDFNNFVCASQDAQLAPDQFAPFAFDEPECAEAYVHGAVLARFEGSGRHVRTWIGMASLMYAPADEEILRIYVDDDPVPRVEAPLAAVLDGSAGEIFAPPFGAGSPRRMAWYYPVAFQSKLIIALDKLGAFDEYFFHCDVVQEAEPAAELEPATRFDRERAIAQLGATFHPSGSHDALAPREAFALEPGQTRDHVVEGPATIEELELRFAESDLEALGHVTARVRWNEATPDAIDVPLLELFAAGRVPPEGSTHAVTSFVEGDERALVLKLPMPFATRARFMLKNEGRDAVSFTVIARGVRELPAEPFGMLHVVDSELTAPTDATGHRFLALEGQGRLVGVCAFVEGEPDPAGGLQYDPLNLLEGDVRIWTDGALALDGTGTEEYADDVFYFSDAPHQNAFVQAWGLVNDVNQSPIGQASLCRWHILGTELDFERSLEASFELGGAGNPEIVRNHRTVAFVYLAR